MFLNPIRYKSYVIFGVLATFVLIMLIGCGGSEDKDGNQGAPAQQAPPTVVEAVVLQPRDLTEEIYASGTILPDESVEVRPEVAGIIEVIRFEEGQQVQKGQVLLQIDNEDLNAQLNKVQEQISLARVKENRQELLLKKGAISKDTYDQTATELEMLKADSAILAISIRKTTVRAPFSGTIGLREISEGSYITPNTIIASLVRDNPVKVEFSIPELYANRVNEGDTIFFTTGANVGDYVGVVYAREPRIDASTRTLRLRARAANPNREISVGAFADITLQLSTFEDALMVPNEAIVPELGLQKVFRVSNGKAETTEVTTGLRQDKLTQILSGLEPGDTVISRGVIKIRQGSNLNISKVTNTDSL